MDTELVVDVQRAIVTNYARVHGPMCALACKRWMEISVQEQNRRKAPHLRELAHEGCESLLRWVWTQWSEEQKNEKKKNELMNAAAGGGHAHLARQAYQWGATTLDVAAWSAKKNGHRLVRNLCDQEWTMEAINREMISAAFEGDEATMRVCHDDLGVTDVNNAMIMAFCGGNTSIMRLCKKWGATNVADVMEMAKRQGNADMILACKQLLVEEELHE